MQQPGGQPPANYHIPADLPLGEGGAKAKFNGNIAAIRLLKQLEAEGRSATPEEQGVLARYVGWGGIPQAFANPSTGKIAAGWEKQVQQLEDALTPDELLAARQSTQNAHYTSREVIGGVFDAVQRLGLSGGTVIEPSVGTGNFIGLTPDALRGALRWTAVELDSITGRIASKLYPQAHVIAGRGFQEVSVPENHFDAAIGNPPFGQETLFDPAHPDLKGFSIHNFFFAKSLKSLRPGGVLAMVVSHSFMDKASGKQRRWISDHARLLGAIRLPDTAFKANAGTEVTTDIVFLQKLHPGEKADATWTEIGSVPDPAGGDPIPLSQYFIQHPEMMLGTMTREGSMRYSGQPTLSERPGSDLSEQLRQAVQHLPQNVMDGPRTIPQGETAPVSDLSEDVAVYSHFIGADGKIRQRMPDVLDQQVERVVEVTGKDADRIKGMIGLRDSLKALMRAELSDAPDATTNRMRAALSDQYDKFQKEYGYLNSQKNVSLFRDDADAYRLRALEVGYTRLSAEEAEAEGITMPKGRKTAESAKKADILSRRVLNPSRTPKAATAQDALIVSLNTTGRVDMQRMAMMLGKDEQAVIDELGGKLFMDPDAGWVTDDAYLSGNVKAKLARAITAASTNPDLQRNVDALRGVQPADLSPADIAVGIGAPWVPGSDYERFASEVLGAQVSVSWNSVASKFSVGMRGSRGNAQHGTSRLTAAELFERAINHQPGMVYDIIREPGGGERRQINNEATTAANAKLDEIRDAFSNWVWKDQARRERLAQFYNDNYNTDRQRAYDGSFLTFPGMTDQIKLRPSQKNAIWRGVQEGRYLLDHVVGAGKTYTVIATAMTAKRMGLQRKPMVAVPNHLVEQWAADWLRLYPGANVLAVTKEDFAKDRRKLLFSRIATGDWDAVVIAHSQFTRIAVPPEFELEYLNEQIAEYEMALDAAKKDRDGMTTKNLAKRRDTIKEKLKARMSRTTRDTDTANMQEMGIDALYVDEAHEFKNLEFVTTKRNVSGLGNPAGSQKAADLFMKVRYLSRTYDGRGTYFATGTPVSNSLAEMFTMQRYLAEADLRARGIHTFDAWSNTFAVEESQFQIDSTGRGLKPKTVLTKFVNVAEMMAIYWRFADIVLQQDLNRIALETTGKPFPVPKVAGGRAQNVVVPAGASLSRYIEQVIIPRTQAIAGEPITYTENGVTMQRMADKPDPSVDNMLKVTNDARLAALDVRLRMPEAADDPGSKVNEAMRRIVAKWKATKKRRGTQLVFCDLSTPKGSQASERAEFDALVSAAENGDEDAQAKLDKMSPDEILALETAGFSVYDDLKQKLIAEGIPAQEIAFIHDAKTDLQKKALFNKVRSGAVRVLMGSTSKMGAGTNVQNKLVALHHLDAPWRPSDLEQREGRIIRQGNEFYAEDPDGFEVEINRYATERTYDSRMWQLIEQKAAVVEQIRTADAGTREIDDIGGQAANAAEMKAAATGNPLIIEQVELQDKVKRLGMLKRAHEGRIYEAERRLASLNADGGPDGRAQRALAEVEPEIAFIDAHPAPRGDAFTIKVKGKTFTEHGKGAAALAVAIVDADEEMKRTTRSNIPLGTYRGLELSLAKSQFLNQRTVTVSIPGLGEVGEIGNPSNAEGKVSGAGILTRVDGFARAIQAKPAGIESQRKAEHKAIAEWTEVAASTFKQAAELSTATERLRDITAELSVKPAAVDQPLQVDESEQGAQSRGEPERARQPLETEFVVGVRDLDRTVRKIVGQWKGDIPTVRAIESADQLPDTAKRQAGWESAEGWYDGRGTIYLIANNLANLTRAQQVLAHEAFGHYGVEGVLGSADWARITGQVAKLRKDPGSLSGELQAALASVERRYPDATPGTFAREFIAVMAERGVRGGLMTRVLAGLRRWLRALGFDFSGWQDAELRDIVVRGMRQVATTAARRRTDGIRGGAMSEQAPTFYSALLETVRAGAGAPRSGTPAQWAGWLDGAQRRGEIRQAERDWLGVDDWMERQNGPITREALTNFVRDSQLVIGETTLGKQEGARTTQQIRLAALDLYLERVPDATEEEIEESSDHIDEWMAGDATLSDTANRLGVRRESLAALRNNSAPDTSKFGKYTLPGVRKNYRETLLTMPSYSAERKLKMDSANDQFNALVDRYGTMDRMPEEQRQKAEQLMREYYALADTESPDYQSSHFEQPNIVAHIRSNERTDADGKRVLFIEEIQSDWHQAGRKKGYKVPTEPLRAQQVRLWNEAEAAERAGNSDEFARLNAEADALGNRIRESQSVAVPDAPFKATDEWAMLAFKRMAREAAQRGFDVIAWTTGDQQAARYDLSKTVSRIEYQKNPSDGTFEVLVLGMDGDGVLWSKDRATQEDIIGTLGKSIADRMEADEGSRVGGIGSDKKALTGDGLKVGGSGMRSFYDSILPKAMNKWAKKFGGKVTSTGLMTGGGLEPFYFVHDRGPNAELRWQVATDHKNGSAPATPFATKAEATAEAARLNGENATMVHAIEVTDAMRAAVLEGQPLFSLPDSQKFDAIMGGIRGEDSIIQRLKDKVEDARPSLLGALTTRQLVEVTGGYLPAAKGYQGLADRMAARRNVLQSEVGGLAMKWQRMQTKDRRKAGAARRAARDTDSDRTADLMHDATIAGTDPAEAYEVSTVTLTSNGETVPLDADSATAAIGRLEAKLADKEWRRNAPDAIVKTMQADIRRIEAGMVVERERASAYPSLKRRFNALPKEWQDLYREVRDAYANRADQMLDALLDRIEQLEIDERTKAALRERMRANFESARVHAPYFPLARFGDYWVSFSKRGANGDMERQFVMAETKRERDRAIKAAEAAGYMVDKLGRKIENVRAQDGASGTFVSEVNEALQAAGVGESVRDEIYQLYLRTLPDLSTRKNFIHRKKVAGYDQDALRAFAGQMFHGAHQLARLEFQPRMQDQLTKIVNEAKAMQDTADEDADRASVAAGEFKKRHEWIMNPTNAGWVQTLSAINFVYYLGVSPAAALVNLSQTAITTFPALASKYGWMRALNTTLATVRDAAKNVRYGDDTGIRRSLKSDDERAAYEQLQKMGAIDVTQAHDLAGLGDSDTRGYSPTAHKVMNAVSFLFHKAEVVNREATAIAAYRLAREAGKPHQAAVQEAADTIWQTHFDYSAANRARFMQGNAAKVLFAFKQYSQSMTYFLWRAFYESMKGETKQVRNEARQRLVGTLGMTGVFAGVMGMPLLSLFFGVANAMAAAFGDDDEPFSAEVEFRNFLTDMLGAKLGGIAQEGLVEGGLEALGLKAPEVGSRVSLNDLWIRSADPDVEGRDLYVHLLEQAAGPIAGMLGNGITASSMIGEGLTTDNAGMVWRGVEKGMPKAVRDGMKFIRYEVHGVNTLRGDPLVPDANVIDSIYQGLGLMPADLARQYEANAAVKQYERYVLERRQSLLDAYAIATRHKDMEAVRATNEKIRAFNQRWPEIAVSASTIRRSLQSRERYSERAVNGITLNSRIGDRVRDAVRFDGEGE